MRRLVRRPSGETKFPHTSGRCSGRLLPRVVPTLGSEMLPHGPTPPGSGHYAHAGGLSDADHQRRHKQVLTDRLGVAEIIFGKSLMVLVAVALLAPFIGAWRVFSLADWKAQFLRATLTVISTFLFIFGLTALPLSTCVMLGSASPLYIAALAPWMSRESVGVDRWGAVVVGFIGVAILVGPPTEGFCTRSHIRSEPPSPAPCGI